MLFLFFRGKVGAVVAAVVEAAGAVAVVVVVAVLAGVAAVIEGRSRIGAEERSGAGVEVFAFSRTRLSRFA